MFRPLKIRHYLMLMENRGFAAADVLAGSKISRAKLDDPAYLVDFTQGRIVIQNIINMTGSQGVGFEFGRDTEFIDLGIVGHAILSCKNIRDALHLWARYAETLLGTMVKLILQERTPNNWSLVLTETVPMGFVYNFCVEEYFTLMCRIGATMTDEGIAVRQIELSYPKPAHAALYKEYLGATPAFNSSQTRITFSAPRLDHALRGNNEEFKNVCVQHCSHIMKQISSKSPLVMRLRNLMMARPGVIPTLEEAARELGMSSRTLRRHLQAESYSYNRLLNEFRFDLAKEYLDSDQITTKEISHLLGFKDADVFRRTFKIWTGKTISEYRSAKGMNASFPSIG